MPLRRRHWIAACSLGVICISRTLASSTGPVPGSSGVPAAGKNAAENTCVMCHTDYPLNPDTLGRIELIGVPQTYIPGKVYALELKVGHPEASRWGFQVTSVSGSDLHGAGDFAPLPQDRTTQRVTNDVGGRVYIEHGATGKATGVGQKGTFSWHFNWTAPASADGDVLFYGAFNAANGDGSNGGDKIYAPNSGLLGRSKPAEPAASRSSFAPPAGIALSSAITRVDTLLQQ